MKQFFVCDQCGGRFQNQEECLKHEQECYKEFPLKAIFFEDILNQSDDKLEICIWEYPKCYIENDKVIFFKKSYKHAFPPSISRLFLENIKHFKPFNDTEIYCIYTTDFSKEHEKECIEKLLNKRKEIYKEELENYTKRCMKIIEGKEEFYIKREKDARYFVSEEDY